MTNEMKDAINTVQRFLDETDGKWDWDDFLSVPVIDSGAKQLQDFCRRLPVDYPPERKIDFCSAQGMEKLRLFLNTVREPSDCKDG